MKDFALLAEEAGKRKEAETYYFRATVLSNLSNLNGSCDENLPAQKIEKAQEMPVKKSMISNKKAEKTKKSRSKKYKLPVDFHRIMKRGKFEEITAVFADKEYLNGLIESKDSSNCPFFTYSPCTEIYKWFVEQGFNIHFDEDYNNQPIHWHAHCSENNIERIILAGGNIEASTGGISGYTPLLVAAKSIQPSSLKVLLKYGANVHAKSWDKMGALELLLRMWRGDSSRTLRAMECMELLIGAGAVVEDRLKDEVITICKDYEKRKDGMSKETIETCEAAMTRMCELFDVERPVPNIHDGTALITVTSEGWSNQHEELWDMLVPGVGKCTTVQGEVIRIGGRISDEIFRNAGGNWDREYRKMLNALKKYYAMGKVHDEKEHQEALALIKSIGRDSDGEDVLRLCEINVHWVLANLRPIMLGEVNYTR